MRYHKSRRAKDTNNYSAVDIECIVGKAKARQEEAAKAATEAAEAEDEARPSFNQENGAEVSSGSRTLAISCTTSGSFIERYSSKQRDSKFAGKLRFFDNFVFG